MTRQDARDIALAQLLLDIYAKAEVFYKTHPAKVSSEKRATMKQWLDAAEILSIDTSKFKEQPK